MSYYTTPSLTRKVVDILTLEVSDSLLTEYISQAQELVLVDITGKEFHEEMIDHEGRAPDIDGSNRLFYTQHKFIADINFDQTVDGNDVTVYLWPDRDDESTIVTVPAADIDSVTPETGLVLFKSGKAPASTYEKLTCSYRYYLSMPNWTIISIAVSLLAGWLWIQKDKLLLPDRTEIGAYRWTIREPAYDRLWRNYIKTINFAKTKKVAKAQIKQQLPWNDKNLINIYYAEVSGID